jgi:ABC-type multidrug transport system ATPase subunit
MKTCYRCGTANADENKFCQQCGKPLPAADGPPPADATVRWTGAAKESRTARREAVPIDVLFAGKKRLVVGRAPDCDVRLSHPSISRYHALVEKLPAGIRLRDLGSVNGVTVGGRRISDAIYVQEREHVGIGPFLFALAGGVLYMLDSSRSLRLEARRLEKVVRLPSGQSRKLLDNVNLVVEPGEFVCLLGPSGCGKSTLMDCLNGRRRATGGQVLANGEDFYRHYDNFRQSLGYVPQKDIVHIQLTVQRALFYTARLRLPVDTDPAELETRIEEVLKEMELVPHRETLVANLSGGQIKRVSLGAELLARPCLLYIDEATSGLDAGTEARMMRLFRRLADEGKSLLCITHNVDNVDRCHLIILLVRGRLVYYGPPQDAPGYFGVRRLSEIYDRLAEKEPEAWQEDFLQSDAYKEFVEKRLAAPSGAPLVQLPKNEAPFGTVVQPSLVNFLAGLTPPEAEPASKSRLPLLAERIRQFAARHGRVRERLAPLFDAAHQLRVLTRRYVELVWSDRRSLRLLLLQAPIVAVFLLVGFAHKPYQKQIPVLRELDPGERRVLEVLNSLATLPAGQAKLDERQAEAFKQMQFTVKGPDGDKHITGADVLLVAGNLRQGSEGLVAIEPLRHVEFAVGEGDERKTVTGEELVQVLHRMRESNLLDTLLKSEFPLVPKKEPMIDPRFTYMLLNILAITVFWFGCNNASKEIVKEEAIYGRERAFNLQILPYLGSKFAVLAVISAVQVLLLLVVVYGVLELLHVTLHQDVPPAEYRLALLPQYGVLVLLAVSGVAMGLLLSACVASPDRASALLPYVLIPQIILGGAIISVRGYALSVLAWTLSPVYWGYQAIHRGSAQLPLYHPMRLEHDFPLTLACGALAVQTLVLLGLTAWFLRRKDIGQA